MLISEMATNICFKYYYSSIIQMIIETIFDVLKIVFK